MGRIIGIDYGEKRIGVALSDPMRIISSPYTMIEKSAGGFEAVAAEIAKICREKEVDQIVIGQPLSMNGMRSASTEKAEVFAQLLEQKCNLPVVRWDERLSTVSAEKLLIEGNTRRNKRKQLVDKVAAQIILQNYLEALDIQVNASSDQH